VFHCPSCSPPMSSVVIHAFELLSANLLYLTSDISYLRFSRRTYLIYSSIQLTYSPSRPLFCPQPSLPPAPAAMCCLAECPLALEAPPSGTLQLRCSVGGTNSAVLSRIHYEVSELDQACVKPKQGVQRLLWQMLQEP
jgi:hypothetical protein